MLGVFLIVESLVPWRARPNFRRESFSALLSGLWLGGVIPFVGLIARDYLNASAFEIGLIWAAPFFGNLLALPLQHKLRVFNPVFIVALLIGGARALLFFCPWMDSSAAFAWTIFTMHCVGSISGPSYALVLRMIYPEDYLGRLLSYTRVVLAGGTIVATLIAGQIVNEDTWRWVILIATPLGVLGMIVFSRIRPPAQIPSDSTSSSTLSFMRESLSLLKTDVGFRFFAGAVFVYGFGNLMLLPVFTIFQVDILRITAAWVGILSIVTQVVWMLSYVFWSRYIDCISPLKIVLACTALTALIPINYIAATEVWMLIPMAVVSGIVAAGIELSYFNSMMQFSSPGNIVQYQGVHSLLLGVRGVLAPFVGASLARICIETDTSLRWIFLLSASLILIGYWLQWVGVRKAEERKRPEGDRE